MNVKMAISMAAIVMSNLLSLANAESPDPKEVEICNAFCAASKKQCDRGVLAPVVSTLGVALALAQVAPVISTGTTNRRSLSQSAKGDDLQDTQPKVLGAQRCEADRLQCAKDCTQADHHFEVTP